MAVASFRDASFNLVVLRSYAGVMGKNYYTKLYISENILRAVIHSVLSVQVGRDWWNQVVDKGIHGTANVVRNRYMTAPTPRSPGRHDIYCVYLSNLGKILFDAKGYFYHLFPQIERVVISVERVLLPRNLIGHMHVLTANDKRSITRLYNQCIEFARALASNKTYTFEYPES